MCKSLPMRWLGLVLIALLSASAERARSADGSTKYTHLQQLPSPKVVASSEPYPGQYEASNLLDDDARTEFASNGKGTNTFVELEFAQESRIAAFRHVDRNDPATVAGSDLVFMDEGGKVVSRLS